ncbi:hypothetical protein FRC04_003151 [Tulasnella sp. 424]|nr:hypothetical protein FRC04_003151 [Tulasnella sp. 424]KAG8966261.1 hypothetical protein FRC05_002720 [Tulasnella sp. 425]
MVLSLDGVPSYGAPAGQLATPCECNTVFYNIIEACAACQGGSINQWQYWIQNCPQSYIGNAFPYPIPAGTQVPTWANIDPTTVGFWSPTIASAYAVGPSASITPGSTSPSPTSTSRPTTVIIHVTPTPTPEGKTSETSTPVGAIAGGVVGGVVLLIVIALGIWFSCFREQRPTTQQYQNDMRSWAPGGTYHAVPSGHMSPNTPGSTAPLQQQQPSYRFYPPSAQSPSNPTIPQSAPSSNHDVPPLMDADPMRQSFYPHHVSQQSLSQFSSGSPQSSPPLEPVRASSTFGPPGVQRGLSLAPSYRTTQ